ncbi:nickel pincer cofactor biosynthesis protein LarB [Carboxydothermus ferrireducens]|uniref:PurE domain-containing protein n=1 Tax=Carboxydothermus ferrireducens DSM 11255 TaxID=1119529 RepID=A0ABX2R963_9THEO|nr:nickel pincer cofactor biosynthesis protein LarB [Carboxydothermus ferrireducens]NYE57585.1 hypothetical protein [Carboxydothermus ferrireducens DSM 11255]
MQDLYNVLKEVETGKITAAKALEILRNEFFEDLGFARVDFHREKRTEFAEVIFAQNKTPEETALIAQKLYERHGRFLATRVSKDHYEAIKKLIPAATYNERAKTAAYYQEGKPRPGNPLIITAGTSDLPVALEAEETLKFAGFKPLTLFDAGVAGIHRLFASIDLIRKAEVIIAVAGMEGALPSVVAGLVSCPVIAVPTSVGYGANFQGLSALLTMLNSCAPGIGVVNIDNGFGAAALAISILGLKEK